MGSRRPQQIAFESCLSVMTDPPFARTKILKGSFKQDTEGNVLEVTTVGDKCPAYPESEDSDPWWDQPVPQAEEE